MDCYLLSLYKWVKDGKMYHNLATIWRFIKFRGESELTRASNMGWTNSHLDVFYFVNYCILCWTYIIIIIIDHKGP